MVAVENMVYQFDKWASKLAGKFIWYVITSSVQFKGRDVIKRQIEEGVWVTESDKKWIRWKKWQTKRKLNEQKVAFKIE